MTRARVLFLTPVMPAEGGNGMAMRAGLWLEGLAASHSVDVLVGPVAGPPAPPGRLVERLAASCEVLELGSQTEQSAIGDRLSTPAGRARMRALHPLPLLSRAATPAAAEAVARAAAGRAAVVAMRLYIAPLLDALLDAPARPAVLLDLDEVESLAWPDGDQAERYRRLEREYLPAVDAVFTSSADEARAVPVPAAVVPNAVRIPPPLNGAADRDLLFVGNLSYAPNVEAVEWLCAEVLPRLPSGVHATVAGSSPGSKVRAATEWAGVELVADPPEVTPWYGRSRVALAPQRRGGGTCIKVLEALAHSRPVVGTPAGARGLGVFGEDGPVLVADEPREFAAACETLLADAAGAARLGAAGRARVEETASVELVAGQIDRLVTDILRAG